MQLLLLFLLVVSLGPISACPVRQGRCPSSQYVSSSLSCSAEGHDGVCPRNYKCCPLTDGMKCFSPCPEFAQPCTIQCPFGFKVDPSPCTVCECAADPCLSTTCPLGTKCITKDYEPCAIAGRCGLSAECISDPSTDVDPTPKPNNCPDYWPWMGQGLETCNGPDAVCPGEEKCCEGPSENMFHSNGGSVSYCVRPCKDISNCTLQCPYELVTDNSCRFCQCASHPCETLTCPKGETCQLFRPTCSNFPGRSPCPLMAGCVNKRDGHFLAVK